MSVTKWNIRLPVRSTNVDTKVVKDGVDIAAEIYDITVTGAVDQPTRVTVTYAACDVTIEAEEDDE